MITDEERATWKSITALYESNPNCTIELDELRTNAKFATNKMMSLAHNFSIGMDDIRRKSDFNTYNHEDLLTERISFDEYTKRYNSNLAMIMRMSNDVIHEIEDVKLLLSLMSILLNRQWVPEDVISPSPNNHVEIPAQTSGVEFMPEFKCIVVGAECQRCIDEWDLNIQRKLFEENKAFQYCRNKCVWCRDFIKSWRLSQLEKKDPTIIAPTPAPVPTAIGPVPSISTAIALIAPAKINTSDKYFYVVLTAPLEDGTPDYLTDTLIKNFRQMFPPSYSATANVFSITIKDGLVELTGLIRYDHRNKYNISPKSKHIKNDIKSSSTGIKQSRYYRVDNLTKYIGRKFETDRQVIVDKYSFISKHGPLQGDTIDRFL